MGSTFSILQLVLDCNDTDDWGGMYGNLPKLALGVISLIFDIIFFYQHFVMFTSRVDGEYTPLLTNQQDDDQDDANNNVPRGLYVNEAGDLIHAESGRAVVVADESIWNQVQEHDSCSVQSINNNNINNNIASLDHAYFGTGCFWNTQKLFNINFGTYLFPGYKQEDGVVGYIGRGMKTGSIAFTSEEISNGSFGHIEVFKSIFEGGDKMFTDMVKFFFQIHDCTVEVQQEKYTSCIFCTSESQYTIARSVKDQLQHLIDCKRIDCFRGKKVLTKVLYAKDYSFHIADVKHQNYLQKHPDIQQQEEGKQRLYFKSWP